MGGNAYPVGIVLLIAKWELMSGPMPKKGRILFGPPVWVVVFAQLYALAEF